MRQVHVAFSQDGETLHGDDHDEILLKNQEVYVDEEGRVGVVPTILNKIADRGFHLQGQIFSYYSTRVQEYVHVGTCPIDSALAVS